MQIAVLGIGQMGKLITQKFLNSGNEVVIWNRSREVLDSIRIELAEYVVSQKLTIVYTLEELQNLLRKPRVIWLQLQPGEPTETVLTQIMGMTEAGDVVINGGDSNFKDTQRHFEEFEKRGVKFLGIGVAGGVHGFENGFSMMIGGNEDGYNYIIPMLENLATPNGLYAFFGQGGAGHFVKMAHNAVEYGMMQSIAEGLAILKKSDYQINIDDALATWQQGGTISSFLLDMTLDALETDPELSQLDGIVGSVSSGKWAVEQAKASGVQVPAIEQSVEFRSRSQYDKTVQETFVARAVQAILKELKS